MVCAISMYTHLHLIGYYSKKAYGVDISLFIPPGGAVVQVGLHIYRYGGYEGEV